MFQAMVEINKLAESPPAGPPGQAFNQMTRWVNTKEEHCSEYTPAIYALFLFCSHRFLKSAIVLSF